MRTFVSVLAAAALLTFGFTAPLAGCGGDDITFGGDDDDDNAKKVTFKGNLDQITPVTSRDIVVFVYSIDDDDDVDRCPCPPELTANELDTLEGRTAVLSSGETEFSIPDLVNGQFQVVFLLDKAGDQADGTIDPGDEIAILDDDDCQLNDVPGDVTVTLNDIDLRFDPAPDEDCTVGNPPADGRARADTIIKQRTTPDDDN
jgi:hypothetical protein